MKKKQSIKIGIFILLVASMIFYIGWVFYVSEPEYIDNCNQKISKYDYVSIKEHKYFFESKQEVITGIVLRSDNETALVKYKGWRTEFYELDLKKSDFRVIGKGTIYHKVNDYVGFNIMLISQFFILVLCAIITFTLVDTLRDIL